MVNISKKIINELEQIQKRCSVRTITTEEIENVLNEYFSRLKISKKSMIGSVVYDCDLNARYFASSYKYTPESTHFSAEYKSNGWVVTSVWRGQTNRYSSKLCVKLSEQAKQAIIDRYSKVSYLYSL